MMWKSLYKNEILQNTLISYDEGLQSTIKYFYWVENLWILR